jgi:hypothetical protein
MRGSEGSRRITGLSHEDIEITSRERRESPKAPWD